MENRETLKKDFPWSTLWWTLGIVAAAVFVSFLIFWLGWIHTIGQTELAYKVDRLNDGKITVFEKKGWVIVPPLIEEYHSIDLKPTRICLGEANVRVLNCKLVQFDPNGLALFIEWHNVQDGDVSRILLPYAFDVNSQEYPFLKILPESTSSSPLSAGAKK